MNQRWRDRLDSYRRPDEVIRTADYDVHPIDLDVVAKAFVTQHHYSRSYPAARWRMGLYRHGELAGVAVFSHPCNDAVLTRVFPGPATDSVELGRFVLLDDVAGNGETWFLARCFDLLRREGLQGVVSFSDPVPRTCAAGRVVFPGHLGTIYQAHNAVFLGRGDGQNLRLLPDGTVFAKRAVMKLRAGHRGWRHVARLLEGYGAPPCPEEGRLAWAVEWTERLTRRLSHPGNHKYAWALHRRSRRVLPPPLPYPKRAA